jgi:hypothetical protein
MRALLSILCVMVIASVAWADKPVQTIDNPIERIHCPFDDIVYDWNFNGSDHGFTPTPCDDAGVPVWEYALPTDYPEWGYVWLTTPGIPYPNDAGEGLLSPAFMVSELTYLVEVEHNYFTEAGFDGCNVKANGELIYPMEGYPYDEINGSTSYYAWCVDGQPGFSGDGGLDAWHYNCFDLTAFMGQEVQLRFDFGSDSSVPAKRSRHV